MGGRDGNFKVQLPYPLTDAMAELLRVLENLQLHHEDQHARYLTKDELWGILVALHSYVLELAHANEN